METLGIFLMGALAGAACVRYSRNKALIAADRERAKTEKALDELTSMRIDQANSAGYIDGYNAARHDLEAQDGVETMNGFFANSLRDGKRVVLGVFDR